MTTPERDRLILIGYWAGPDTVGPWPSVEDFVDPMWEEEQRSFVVDYLRGGHVVWGFAGWSRCRFCGKNNGDRELSDGRYLWPDGLVHYVEDHAVRLPKAFVAHAEARLERLEQAERDPTWWRSTPPSPRATSAADARPRQIGAGLEDAEQRTVMTDDVDVSGGLAGRAHVLRAVDELGQELAAGTPARWENPTLERFLDAFGALLGVIEQSYTNAGRPVPLDPWVLVADALRGAREYE